MKKRTLTLLLACLMLLPALASCSENAADTTDDTPPEIATTAPSNDTAPSADEETVPQNDEEEKEEEEEEEEIQPDIPAADFGGETFTFLTSGPNDTNGVDWETYDIWVEQLTGDVINDAVMERNLYLEATYNVKMAEYKTNADTLSEINTEVKAGTQAFDAAITHIENGANLSQTGALVNLYNLPYVDLSRPWWDQRAVEDLTVLNGLYWATGDITVIDNDATWVLMFNKQMREDLQMEDFYDLVREDRWTYDLLYSYAEQASIDANGDGKMNWKDDTFGIISGSSGMAHALIHASGEKLVLGDKEAVFVIPSDFTRLEGVAEKAALIVGDKNVTLLDGYDGATTVDTRVTFQEGRGLFYSEVMQCITRMRDSETDFGLLPWPKYDETQSEYYNWIHSTAGKGVVVPTTQTDYELTGTILEAMAAKSMYTLTPAYYDVALTYKYMRDEESAEMLDIILQSRVYDVGQIYNFASFSSTLAGNINSGNASFASSWARMERAFTKAMEKAVERYEKLEGNG